MKGNWLEIRKLGRDYGDFTLDIPALDCPRGAQLAILGPSGSGKSTLLRILAGLERADRGSIGLAGRELSSVPARKRGIGLVFQDFALFPHLDVWHNVAYGLGWRGLDRGSRRTRVASLLERFSIAGLARRSIHTLSGGERQRVALARALAVQPDLMLFDEPLSSLDAALRRRLRKELRQLQQSLGFTSLLVTHDQEDALAAADLVAIMHQGRVLRQGSPQEVYHSPGSVFAATFLGESNLIQDSTGQIWGFRPESPGILSPDPDSGRQAGVLAKSKTGAETSEALVLSCRVEEASFQGRDWSVHVLAALPPGWQIYTPAPEPWSGLTVRYPSPLEPGSRLEWRLPKTSLFPLEA